jgi:hypothetical protein
MSTPTNTDNMSSYRSVALFGLNLNVGGKTESFTVKPGATVLFDGIYASYDGIIGEARNLNKVIGEWLVASDGESATTQANAPVQAEKPVPNPSSSASDVRESSRNLVIESTDEQVVAKTGSSDETFSNTQGIYIDKSQRVETKVISDEQRVVKTTSYENSTGKTASERRESGYESGSGQEAQAVYKSARATAASTGTFEVDNKASTLGADTQYDGKAQVTQIVGNSVPEPEPSSITESGAAVLSSAKQVLDSDTVHTPNLTENQDSSSIKVASTEKAEPTRSISLDANAGSDGVVVAKTTTLKTGKVVDGIETSVTIGGSEEIPEVTATVGSSNNQEAIIMSKEASVSGTYKEGDSVQAAQVEQVDISKFEVAGQVWADLHWVKKISFIKECDNQVILQSIKTQAKNPNKVLEALDARISELGNTLTV